LFEKNEKLARLYMYKTTNTTQLTDKQINILYI